MRGVSLRAVVTGFVVGLVAALAGPAPAHAHGEQTQEAFLRASTVLLYDVRFSDTTVDVGEEVTITGRLRVMNAWPDHTVPAPELGFLSVVSPGPVVAVKDRRMSGVFTPQSVEIEKGQTFPFSVTVVAREPGRWHVHPSFAVEGTGTLVGRGEWLESGEGTYRNQAVLPGGERIDLNTYGLGQVIGWHLIAFLIGLAWLAFWLRRPVLDRLAAVSSGRGRALTSRRDVMVGLAFAGVIAVVLGAGYAYATATAPRDPMPLQVARVAPPAAPEAEPLVSAAVTGAAYDQARDEVELTLKLRNTSERPVRLAALQIAEETLVPKGAAAAGAIDALTLSPDSPLEAGADRAVTVRIDAARLHERNLLPLREPQVRLTGLLFFTDSAGNRQVSEVDEVTSPLIPK